MFLFKSKLIICSFEKRMYLVQNKAVFNTVPFFNSELVISNFVFEFIANFFF